MGNEATVRAKVNGRADQGRALLETNELVFRGARRCAVKLDAATRAAARAKGGWLTVGSLSLELGADQAGKWLVKIQRPKSVLEKLGVKRGQVAALVSLDDEVAFARQLAEHGVTLGKNATVVFFQVRTVKDLERLPKLRKALPDDGVLWLLRPKGKDAPVGERDTMAAGKAAGLVDVKVVAFSDTLSAEKYVVPLRDRK